MLLYFCDVFHNKRLNLIVLPTTILDIVISCDLFPSCSLCPYGFQIYFTVGLEYPILDRIRFYFIKSKLHCGVKSNYTYVVLQFLNGYVEVTCFTQA